MLVETDDPFPQAWPTYGKRLMIHTYRCLSCAAREVARRIFYADPANKDDPKSPPEQPRPADGRLFIARPVTEEAPGG